MRDGAPSSRLISAAEFVRQDAVFADIGTDHAYLPIFLLKEGRVKRAIASDINVGPLARARENAERAGLAERLELSEGDGAAHLSGRGITDYAICGMGGELIASIIERAPHLREIGIRLILGPNSRQAHLRGYLLGAGFEILAETYSLDGGKYYLTILAEYTGVKSEIDPVTAEIGLKSPENANKCLQIGYLEGKLAAFRAAILGKEKGGLDPSAERRTAQALEQKIKELKLN